VNSAPASPDPPSSLQRRGLWAFWAATALALAGVIAPLLLGGGSSRINATVIAFGVAAIAFGACALVYRQGRPIATALYFLASLAVVYGILSALAIPLRVAMLGACPADSGPCLPGLERPISTEESAALGFVIGIGIVTILTGFFGLRTVYQHHRHVSQPAAPPVRRIAPVAGKPSVETTPAPSPAPAAKSTESSAPMSEAPAEPETQPELPAHEPDLELPAHVTEAPAEPSRSAPTTAAQRLPRRRKPKAPPESPTSPNTE
jgi:MFS family permease